ncbi:hypothetical protein [Frateuria sp. STR12]|uniref:hypothetical protein n=1 Tax=Frateuria hangzhouensis TaxID=2995589 RepID=UPI002260901E|nr:hypothetical protein [Frateuria sp. STR12]MCX7514555.1 hypothetical protein [Frateuria sp. STR12]
MIDAPRRTGAWVVPARRPSFTQESRMPRPSSILAAAVAAPLLGLALYAAVPAHAAGQATAVRPNNLCASCHGGGKVVSLDADALDARDMLAARTYLQDAPRG